MIEVVKGGLILDLGVRGFLPASLVDIRRVQDLDEFLGTELRCKVIELNRSRNNVVLSRRAVLEDERKEMRQAILDRLNPGDVVPGVISNIVDFGAFVDLDGMDGLIHISELSWSHVNHPSEVLEIGQEVQVKVLDIDRDRQRISLGLKQTQSDPWQQVLDSYSVNDVVQGRVTKVVTFGAFVEILPGVEGLVHISELAAHHVENPREIVSQGDVVSVKIIEMDAERRRLSLSLSASRARSRGRGPRARRRCGCPRRSSRRARPPRRGGRGAEAARGRARQLLEAERSLQSGAAEAARKPSQSARAEPEPVAESRAGARAPRRRRPSEAEAEAEADADRQSREEPEPERVRSPLTGGIGAGKSEALEAFERGGAAVCSSDEIVHRLIARGPGGAGGARGALRDDRPRAHRRDRLRRPRGARLARSSSSTRASAREYAGLARPARRSVDVAVVEIPLLYETGAEALFDAVVVVTAPEESAPRAGRRDAR